MAAAEVHMNAYISAYECMAGLQVVKTSTFIKYLDFFIIVLLIVNETNFS